MFKLILFYTLVFFLMGFDSIRPDSLSYPEYVWLVVLTYGCALTMIDHNLTRWIAGGLWVTVFMVAVLSNSYTNFLPPITFSWWMLSTTIFSLLVSVTTIETDTTIRINRKGSGIRKKSKGSDHWTDFDMDVSDHVSTSRLKGIRWWLRWFFRWRMGQ